MRPKRPQGPLGARTAPCEGLVASPKMRLTGLPASVTFKRIWKHLAKILTEKSLNAIDNAEPIVELIGAHKSYRLDSVDVHVLKGVSLLIRPRQFTVLMGPSGSGKTTLLNLIGCIDKPDSGRVVVAGQNVLPLSDDTLSEFRRHHIGFIFQNFNLLPVLTAYENIEYPMVLAGIEHKVRSDRTRKLLSMVGLSDRARNLPGQLSGGQRQRVAIARALALRPKLVIADEPTANLDSQTAASILALMRSMQARHQTSFVFSSHDTAVVRAADDVIYIKDGSIRGIRRKTGDPTKHSASTSE